MADDKTQDNSRPDDDSRPKNSIGNADNNPPLPPTPPPTTKDTTPAVELIDDFDLSQSSLHNKEIREGREGLMQVMTPGRDERNGVVEYLVNPELDREYKKILKELTLEQVMYIAARLLTDTDEAAAGSLNISVSTVKGWMRKTDVGHGNKRRLGMVRRALELVETDGMLLTLAMRRKALPKAMLVKVKGLDSEDERLRQSVSSEIIEWETGKAGSKVELGGGVELIWNPHKPREE